MRTTISKQTILFACCLGLAAVAQASEEAGLSAVRDLGRLNGQALACGNKDTASWVRILMLNHAPKTRAYGEAYEEGTQETFAAHGRGEPCAAPAVLSARLDAVTQRLKIVLPIPGQVPQGHSQAEVATNAVVPRYLLQDPNGRAVTNEDFLGRFQLIAFGFVTCPDVCPTTMAEMKAVLARLGPRAAQLQPLFISVDPERDTLPVLREYTAAFDARIVGLTGPLALVERAAQSFKVKFEKVPSPGGDPKAYTVDHTAAMFLVGPDGQLLSRLGYGMPVADIVARVERWMSAAGQ